LKDLHIGGTRKVAAVSMFTALAVGTDYAMLPLANVKLMDSIVFISALAFGVSVGASVATLTWLIYGEVNPLGADSAALLLLLIASEMVYVALGYLARRMMRPDQSVPERCVLWGSFGLIGALLYDLTTIIVPYLMIGESLRVAVASLIFAVPFMLAHELSDFFFFATVAPAIYVAVRSIALRNTVRVSADPLKPQQV
jgi:hypothetical protein